MTDGSSTARGDPSYARRSAFISQLLTLLYLQAITKPIRLAHNETVSGANEFEAYQLRNEVIPLSSWMPRPVDEIPGWTFYRYITPVGTPVTLPITDATPGFWSPLFHFLPISVSRVKSPRLMRSFVIDTMFNLYH